VLLLPGMVGAGAVAVLLRESQRLGQAAADVPGDVHQRRASGRDHDASALRCPQSGRAPADRAVGSGDPLVLRRDHAGGPGAGERRLRRERGARCDLPARVRGLEQGSARPLRLVRNRRARVRAVRLPALNGPARLSADVGAARVYRPSPSTRDYFSALIATFAIASRISRLGETLASTPSPCTVLVKNRA